MREWGWETVAWVPDCLMGLKRCGQFFPHFFLPFALFIVENSLLMGREGFLGHSGALYFRISTPIADLQGTYIVHTVVCYLV